MSINVKIPIILFDAKEVGIDSSYSQKIANFYSEYEKDNYLLHKRKIDYLFKNNVLDTLDYNTDIASLKLQENVKEVLES